MKKISLDPAQLHLYDFAGCNISSWKSLIRQSKLLVALGYYYSYLKPEMGVTRTKLTGYVIILLS